MADSDNAAATATNPAPVQAAESSSNPAPDLKASTSTEATQEPKATNGDAAENKSAANGASDHRADRHDRNGRDDRRNHSRGGRGGRGGRGNRGGRGGGGGFKSNKRREEDFDNLPESDDPVEIRNQVEFYFSTQNLTTDEHMFHELGGPENRPVSIKHISEFKRMRHFRPYSAVVDALRDSNDLIVVDDGVYDGLGREAVKRKEPLVVPLEDGVDSTTLSTTDLFYRLKRSSRNKLETCIYVKDFGNLDEAGQLAIEQFFRPYGSILVRKRRDDRGSWKGSVFVEFDSEDSQKQFLALDPKPKFKDNELTIMSKKDYIIKKCEEKGIEPDWDHDKGGKKGGNRAIDRHRDGERGGRRGGRNGRRGNDRRTRDHSPRRRRDRSASNDSVDSREWNTRRSRFKDGKDDRGSHRAERKEIEVDAHGVPVVRDTRADAEIAAASKKRKANDEERGGSPKKGKLEIKEDE